MTAVVQDLSLRVTHLADEVAVVHVRGAVDVRCGVRLAEQLHDLVDAGSPRCLVDLTHVPSCGTTGLAALIVGRTHALAHDGWVRTVAPCPPVAAVLARAAPALPHYPTVAAALQSGDPAPA